MGRRGGVCPQGPMSKASTALLHGTWATAIEQRKAPKTEASARVTISIQKIETLKSCPTTSRKVKAAERADNRG